MRVTAAALVNRATSVPAAADGVRSYHDHLRTVLPVLNLEHRPEPGSLAELNRRMREAA